LQFAETFYLQKRCVPSSNLHLHIARKLTEMQFEAEVV